MQQAGVAVEGLDLERLTQDNAGEIDAAAPETKRRGQLALTWRRFRRHKPAEAAWRSWR